MKIFVCSTFFPSFSFSPLSVWDAKYWPWQAIFDDWKCCNWPGSLRFNDGSQLCPQSPPRVKCEVTAQRPSCELASQVQKGDLRVGQCDKASARTAWRATTLWVIHRCRGQIGANALTDQNRVVRRVGLGGSGAHTNTYLPHWSGPRQRAAGCPSASGICRVRQTSRAACSPPGPVPPPASGAEGPGPPPGSGSGSTT